MMRLSRPSCLATKWKQNKKGCGDRAAVFEEQLNDCLHSLVSSRLLRPLYFKKFPLRHPFDPPRCLPGSRLRKSNDLKCWTLPGRCWGLLSEEVWF